VSASIGSRDAQAIDESRSRASRPAVRPRARQPLPGVHHSRNNGAQRMVGTRPVFRPSLWKAPLGCDPRDGGERMLPGPERESESKRLRV
jgi:hypothetical protein